MPKIGLDAGHGGNSTGTHSCNTQKDKLYEKHHTLELVKLVAERLKANGFETFLTRTSDINCGTVSERAKACVNNKCDYAVSIHFNGFDDEKANGCEVFVPFGEKGAGIEAGYYNYLGKFFKLRQPFARCYYPGKTEVFDKKLNVKTRKFEAVSDAQNYFGFIRTAWKNGLSADLLEVCFLTNKKDFDTYTENKAAIADAIARSIVEGYKKAYKSKISGNTTLSTGEKEVSTKNETVSTAAHYQKGTPLNLKNVKLYVSSTASTATKTVSGTYYVWSSEAKNGRIRVTVKESYVGIAGMVTGWIDVPERTFRAGEMLKLSKTPLYFSATAKTARTKISGNYYVWSSEINNNRIRITNKSKNVGVNKQVTGFVDLADI